MEDNLLRKLANIAIVRQHINHIVNSGVDRKNINPIQKIGKELDIEFVDLLTSKHNETDYKNKIERAINIVKTDIAKEDVEIDNDEKNISEEDLSHYPSKTALISRPEIKANSRYNEVYDKASGDFASNLSNKLSSADEEIKEKSEVRPKIKTSKNKTDKSKE